MVGWGRRKDGRYYPKRPRGPSSYDVNPFTTKDDSFNKKYNWDRQARFTADVIKDWKNEHFKKEIGPKDERFAHAKILLKSVAPWIALMEPTCSTIFSAWRFGNYSYHFLSKVYHEYQITGSLEKGLLKATQNELDRNIIPKLKSITIKNISEIAAKNLWLNFKKENTYLKIPSNWDKHAEDAMADTLEQIINMGV